MTPLQKVMEYATLVTVLPFGDQPQYEVRVTVPHPKTGDEKTIRIECADPEDGLLEAWVQAMREHERADQAAAREREGSRARD